MSDGLSLRNILNILASIKLALFLLFCIAVACIVGSLGFSNIYSSWFFIGLLCLLAMSLSLCTFRRYSILLKQKGALRFRDLGSLFVHISILLILTGGVIRGIWGEKGYVTLRKGQMTDFMEAEGGNIDLPFVIQLHEFIVERHEPESSKDLPQASPEGLVVYNRRNEQVLRIPVVIDGESYDLGSAKEKNVSAKILKRIPDFAIDVETGRISAKSEDLKNPALLVELTDSVVTNKLWIFARFPADPILVFGKMSDATIAFPLFYEVLYNNDPKGLVKDYKSTLRILEHGKLVKEKTIEVNSPLVYKGYSIYQEGYDPVNEAWSSLQLVKDPSVPVVYTGFILMILGLSMVFYLKPGNVSHLKEPEE